MINRGVYQRDYGAFARFFFGALATEPHSTKLVEDMVGWALDGTPEAMTADADVKLRPSIARASRRSARRSAVRC